MTKLTTIIGVLSLCFVLCYADDVSDYKHTPFGLKHKDCILEVPSGTHIEARIIDGIEHVHVLHPNGTSNLHSPCPHGDPHEKRTVYVWNGWPMHYWYGTDYGYFTNPALTSPVTLFEATWNVPNYPSIRTGNSGAPWPNEQTLSWWTGLQPNGQGTINTVLQPVMEFNGLIANSYDLSSWNCCPAGYTFHSTAIAINPGQTANGTMRVTSPNVYSIESSVVGGASTTLTANFASSPPVFEWAEIKNEGYYVTNRAQLPEQAVTFKINRFVTQSGSLNVNTIPWKQGYQCDSTACPSAAISSSCVGYATQSNNEVSIGFK